MKTLKIGIAGYDRMKARTVAIARGEHKPASGDPTVWFTPIESFAKVLSQRNRELLAMIAREKPDSLTELAELAGRSKSNLSRTLKTMSRYGLVELKKGQCGTLVPRVPYDRVSLDVSLISTSRRVAQTRRNQPATARIGDLSRVWGRATGPRQPDRPSRRLGPYPPA